MVRSGERNGSKNSAGSIACSRDVQPWFSKEYKSSILEGLETTSAEIRDEPADRMDVSVTSSSGIDMD
jgi:hypothetical protein